jgi:hypothetical protein
LAAAGDPYAGATIRHSRVPEAIIHHPNQVIEIK